MLRPFDRTAATSVRADPTSGTAHWQIGYRSAAVGLAALLFAVQAEAVGLGELRVQSGLGQPLRATVALFGDGAATKSATCFNARLSSADGAFIANPQISIVPSGANASVLVSTNMSVGEPAVSLTLEMACGDALRKEFAVLLDPPLVAAQVAGSDASGRNPARTKVASSAAIAGAAAAGATGASPSAPGAGTGAAAKTASSTNKPIAAGSPVPVRIAPAVAKPVALLPRVQNKPIAPRATGTAKPRVLAASELDKHNVLRLTVNQGKDIDLINAIGLRLALADQLPARQVNATAAGAAASVAPAAGSAIPDLAQSSAMQAARRRFAATLRDDPNGDTVSLETERKLQQLQAKMQVLETETNRIRQAGQRNAVAAVAAAPRNDGLSADLWMILAGFLALAIGVIAWLLLRVRRLKEQNTPWQWEDTVIAADAMGAGEAAGTAAPHAPVATAQSVAMSPPVVRLDALAAVPVPMAATAAPPATARVSAAPASATPVAPMLTIPDTTAPVAADIAPMEFTSELPSPRANLTAPLQPPLPALPPLTALQPLPAVPSVPTSARSVPVPPLVLDDLQFDEIKLIATPAVEEISDVMQEAEFWMSLNDALRAIEVLEPYATSTQSNSPLPWLYLFDLYRQVALREKYDLLHEHFERTFNCKIMTWSELELQLPNAPTRSIEEVPHVMEKIVDLWGGDEAIGYLESLLMDDRAGNRIGFDLPVYREIMFLIAIAAEVQQAHPLAKPSGSSGLTLAA
jgi:pilus assembly protein FimV